MLVISYTNNVQDTNTTTEMKITHNLNCKVANTQFPATHSDVILPTNRSLSCYSG
jgi:hypothetical protein